MNWDYILENLTCQSKTLGCVLMRRQQLGALYQAKLGWHAPAMVVLCRGRRCPCGETPLCSWGQGRGGRASAGAARRTEIWNHPHRIRTKFPLNAEEFSKCWVTRLDTEEPRRIGGNEMNHSQSALWEPSELLSLPRLPCSQSHGTQDAEIRETGEMNAPWTQQTPSSVDGGPRSQGRTPPDQHQLHACLWGGVAVSPAGMPRWTVMCSHVPVSYRRGSVS